MLSFDNEHTFELLLDACSEFQVDPTSSLVAESFFRNLLQSYSGSQNDEAVVTWLNEKLAQNFVSIGDRPHWIQNPQWPFVNGVPMIFVGQLEIKNPPRSVFHDDTTFYVFVNKGSQPIVVMQQY